MFVYNHQRDSEYLSRLNNILQLENLLKTALPVKNPKIYGSTNHKKKYDKCLRIDFSGISALLLHDNTTLPSISQKLLRDIQESFSKIFDEIDYINSQGVFISIRFLLVYPFCAHAQTRIQAELSKNRATIQEDKYSRDWMFVEPVIESKFIASSLLQTQNNLLRFLYDKSYKYGLIETSLNRLVIRFVPMAVNQSVLCINDNLFSVPYLLAKHQRTDSRLVSCAPIIQITRTDHGETFDAYLDHFRYLWELPQTIDSADAVELEASSSDFMHIKCPDDIVYQKKSERILEKRKRSTKGSMESRKQILRWKRKVKYLLHNQCPVVPKQIPSDEKIFIACSWEQDIEKPNTFALELKNLLQSDFNEFDIETTIVDGSGGSSLKEEVYGNLNSTTVGLILCTRDIDAGDGTYYTRPNIYHELGYLMGRLEGKDSPRVIPVIEEGVCLASNVTDLITHKFTSNDGIILIYHRILNDLLKVFDFDLDIKAVLYETQYKRLLDKLDGKSKEQQKLIKTINQVKVEIQNLKT